LYYYNDYLCVSLTSKTNIMTTFQKCIKTNKVSFFRNVKQVTVSTEIPIKRKVPKHIITFSSWQRRNYDKNNPDHNIIEYSTNFSAN